ncbi:hypothetical protein B0H15DRAFT_944254 [Mycena belliarum]|uniref:Uncharacterized protein n=1 Tax=Mycena belliarum TaxID=1033014 RepID=A0AAD6UI03_9AGAR|nr:hypothetical protein B0H15DRAFT_944254 [Mycena belliae]
MSLDGRHKQYAKKYAGQPCSPRIEDTFNRGEFPSDNSCHYASRRPLQPQLGQLKKLSDGKTSGPPVRHRVPPRQGSSEPLQARASAPPAQPIDAAPNPKRVVSRVGPCTSPLIATEDRRPKTAAAHAFRAKGGGACRDRPTADPSVARIAAPPARAREQRRRTGRVDATETREREMDCCVNAAVLMLLPLLEFGAACISGNPRPPSPQLCALRHPATQSHRPSHRSSSVSTVGMTRTPSSEAAGNRRARAWHAAAPDKLERVRRSGARWGLKLVKHVLETVLPGCSAEQQRTRGGVGDDVSVEQGS